MVYQNTRYSKEVRLCAMLPKSDIMVKLCWRRKAVEVNPEAHCIRNLNKSGTTWIFNSRRKLFVHTKK